MRGVNDRRRELPIGFLLFSSTSSCMFRVPSAVEGGQNTKIQSTYIDWIFSLKQYMWGNTGIRGIMGIF